MCELMCKKKHTQRKYGNKNSRRNGGGTYQIGACAKKASIREPCKRRIEKMYRKEEQKIEEVRSEHHEKKKEKNRKDLLDQDEREAGLL